MIFYHHVHYIKKYFKQKLNDFYYKKKERRWFLLIHIINIFVCESIKNILKVKLFFFKLNHVNFIITIDSNRHSLWKILLKNHLYWKLIVYFKNVRFCKILIVHIFNLSAMPFHLFYMWNDVLFLRLSF